MEKMKLIIDFEKSISKREANDLMALTKAHRIWAKRIFKYDHEEKNCIILPDIICDYYFDVDAIGGAYCMFSWKLV